MSQNFKPLTTETFSVAGVTFDRRQQYLIYLRNQNPNDIRIIFRRERNNTHDANAIRIGAKNTLTGIFVDLGYVPKEIAVRFAPIMDTGNFIYIKNYCVTGNAGCAYGLSITVAY